MTAVDILIPRRRPRRWQRVVVERLVEGGHVVTVRPIEAPTSLTSGAEAILKLEKRAFGKGGTLAARERDFPFLDGAGEAELTLDLTGAAPAAGSPMLSLRFNGAPSLNRAMTALAAGQLVDLEVVRDGRSVIARAAPMVDERVLVGRALDDVLARAITLLVAAVDRFGRGELFEGDALPPPTVHHPSMLSSFAFSAIPRLGREGWRRAHYRHAHWRVGYRFHTGPGVAETGVLGNGWSVLPDDGSRFYADPFPFEHDGQHCVFVEDYPHATRKAVISVARAEDGGRLGRPVPVLEEPWHLSYPQVFERDGEIWMIPESSGGRNVTLYRAADFPHGWRREAVLIADREISDATLLEHGGLLWLFATDRDGYGSTSDTLVVYHAERLLGPWLPHRQNPILIDRGAGRPGGAFREVDGTTILPVQDGTLGYGGGLGFSAIEQLDLSSVRLSRPVPVVSTGDFPYPRIHTYNRAGRLEVIDGIARVRKP